METAKKEKEVQGIVINSQRVSSEIPSLKLRFHSTYFAYRMGMEVDPEFFVMYNADLSTEEREEVALFFEKLAEDIREAGKEVAQIGQRSPGR